MGRNDYLHRACPVCGSTRKREEAGSRTRAELQPFGTLRPFWSGLFKEKRFFTYHRCAQCGLLYNPTYFNAAQLAGLYADMAPNMDAVESEAILATQRGYFERAVAGARLDGDYLEIGPDVGHIVGEAARSGAFRHFWLFEPNRAIHDTLRAAAGHHPATLLTDMDDLSPVPDGSAGLAVMIHVLDHLLDPLAALAQLRAKLRPGGTLMIVTHNERSLLRRAMGVRWPPFCLQHPELYNPATMREMLTRAGFAEIAVERSRNHFPIPFLARQAAWAMGVKLRRVPLPALSVGLRLGNILTLARRPVQAPPRTPSQAAARPVRQLDIA